jgi:ABC-2 type transport system ATP-binding protein
LEHIITIEHLSKQYRGSGVYALEDLSLTVERGMIFGLLGPNGAGKTTLLSILCGLVAPTSGSFTIAGYNYGSHGRQIRRIMGVVPQEYALYPTLTARENLNYFGSMYGLSGRTLRNKVEGGLEFMGLAEFAGKRLETFSGGMKRRINLLAGILHDPEILFLDEPTVGVDVHSKNAILEFLKLRNAAGTTMIYTSHHLQEAQEFCTETAIMDRGRVYARDLPSRLVAQTPGARNLEDVFIALTGKALRDHA